MPGLSDAGADNTNLSELEAFAVKQLKIIQRTNTVRKNEEEKLLRMFVSMRSNYEEVSAQDEAKIRQKAMKALVASRGNYWKQLSAIDRAESMKAAQERFKDESAARIDAKKQEIAEMQARAKYDKTLSSEVSRLKRELKKMEKADAKEEQKMFENVRKAKVDAAVEEYEIKKKAHKDELAFQKQRQDEIKKGGPSREGAKAKRQEAMEKLEGGEKLTEVFKSFGASLAESAALFAKSNPLDKLKNASKAADEKAAASKERLDTLNEAYEQAKKEGASDEDLEKMRQALIEAQQEATKDANEANALKLANAIADQLGADYKNALNDAETVMTDYMGKMNARLQGTEMDFKSVNDKVTSIMSINPFVKTTAVLDKLREATEQGIAFNLEQRSFLGTISEKIAHTFDAFDSNLTRLIRLQQADSTAARLGMEATLTKLFNSMFNDSSYLNNTADTVAGALIGASSQLDYQRAAEFEFTVQKWLGALSSLGLSDDAVNTIAQGLNYMATGDVTNMANNSSLQTLFAMASTKSNLEYSELLLEGLDASNTNKLLKGMVEYLKEIAENSENQVVKAAYSDILNINAADLKAISNITANEISKLESTGMTYGDMKSELSSQFLQMFTRESMASMLLTAYDNVMYSVASDMVNNPVTFAMQKMLDFMNDKETDIAIPFVNVYGFGLDINATVKDIMQMGLGIAQSFSLVTNIMKGLTGGGGMDLDAWGGTELNKRGGGIFNLSTASTLGGVSGSMGTSTMNQNSDDAATSSISSATDDSEESSKITNKNSDPPEKSLDDLFTAIIGDSAESFAVTYDGSIMKAYDPLTQSLRVMDARIEVDSGAMMVRDIDAINVLEENAMRMIALLSNIDTNTKALSALSGLGIGTSSSSSSSDKSFEEALKAVLFSDEDNSLGTMIKKLLAGEVVINKVNTPVEVVNSAGSKLQVSNLVW